MDKKKKIVIGLCIIGIIIILIGFIIFRNNKSNNDDNDIDIDNSPKPSNSVDAVITVSTFDISKFEILENTSKKVSMVFKLTNKSNQAILSKNLDINMYNGDNLLYTYGYMIENLEIDEYIYVEATAEFTHQNISKYEFIIDESKVTIQPTINE